MLVAAAGASPASLRDRARALRSQNETLEARSKSAVLQLYALDSELSRTRAGLVVLHGRADELRRERAAVANRLAVARRASRVAQRHLADHLRFLYVQGDTDPLEILLGARSLEEAITQLDAVQRTANLNASVIRQASAAERELRAAAAELARRSAEVERMEARAEAEAAALARTRAERSGYVATLRQRRSLNAREVARLEVQARAAEARSQDLAAAPAIPAQPDAVPAAGARTLTVTATGYSIHGQTATGIPAGWGVVAVDPSVIPLGTRLTIPGYGEAIAADVGSGVHGAMIDLWFPTDGQARAWGRRVVSVVLH